MNAKIHEFPECWETGSMSGPGQLVVFHGGAESEAVRLPDLMQAQWHPVTGGNGVA